MMAADFVRKMALFLLVAWALCLIPAGGSALARPDDFQDQAKEALDQEDYPRLETLAQAQLDSDPEDFRAHAFLALGLAGQQKFDPAVAALVALKESGHPANRSLRGLGNPLSLIVNIIYMTCWANFSEDFNRKAWSSLFNAFEDRSEMVIPASRLLMVALKAKDEAEQVRLEAWFEARLEKNMDNPAGLRNIYHNYARGYLRAHVGSPRAVELAAEAFRLAWENTEAACKEVTDPLELQEKCDLSTDHEYWDLALACSLGKVYDPPENPLAVREAEPGALFEDITADAGFDGIRLSRVAASDYDQDGYTDLCFAGRLFRNLKGKKFVEVTKEVGLTRTGLGAIFFDFDNDGYLDLLVSAAPYPHLFRNKGKKGKFAFEEATQSAGLDKLKLGSSPEGAAVFDMDNDGCLDFYLAAYENPYPVGHPDLLVRNNGDGTFSDVSDERGTSAGGKLCGRGVCCSDFDQDGDMDIYVSNYRLLENFLWVNQGDGHFTNGGEATGLRGLEEGGAFGHTIGSCWGDVDNDGHIDLFCANLAHPRFVKQGFSNLSMLYMNEKRGEKRGTGSFFPVSGKSVPVPLFSPLFSEERRARGIRFQETHSDPAFADYDNDGDLDLFITCIYEGAPSVFYQNDGKGFFTPIGFRSRHVAFNGWGQAWFDMDNDGDLDHVVASGSGVKLFRNLGNENKWVKVRLKGKKRNRFGVGARVKVTTPEGLSLVREARAGRGTQSQDDSLLHFGLGPEASAVRVEVTWPTGRTRVTRGKVNTVVEAKQVKDYPRKK